jgi:hypothetical protein
MKTAAATTTSATKTAQHQQQQQQQQLKSGMHTQRTHRKHVEIEGQGLAYEPRYDHHERENKDRDLGS